MQVLLQLLISIQLLVCSVQCTLFVHSKWFSYWRITEGGSHNERQFIYFLWKIGTFFGKSAVVIYLDVLKNVICQKQNLFSVTFSDMCCNCVFLRTASYTRGIKWSCRNVGSYDFWRGLPSCSSENRMWADHSRCGWYQTHRCIRYIFIFEGSL